MEKQNLAQQLQAIGFNILSTEDVPSAEVTIKDPVTNAPTAFIIEVAGPEHPLRKQAGYTQSRRMRQELLKTGKPVLDDPEQEDQDQPSNIAGFTLSWRVEGASVQPPFSRDLAEQLYREKHWLMHQVKTAMDERERFIKRSAAS